MTETHIVTVGLNHRTAPIVLRERFSVSEKKIPESLSAFTAHTGNPFCVLLSTCNRTEVYTLLSKHNGGLSRIKSFFSDHYQVSLREFDPALYVFSGIDGVEHLFKVTAGLDSQVLGESEITGQVKQAYQIAHTEKKVERVLHHVFQRSLRVAKKVRTETGIGRGVCSIGSVAVEMAGKIFGDLSNHSVLILGAGKMGELAARHLLKAGTESIFVSNRSWPRAKMLADKLQGRAVRLDQLMHQLTIVDIAISSTASPRTLVTKEMIAEVMMRRHGKPLFLIDIAVPRDVDPEVNQIENVFLYDIDDLEKITRDAYEKRTLEMEKGIRLIKEEARRVETLFPRFLSHG